MSNHEAGAAGFSTLLETMAQLDFFTLVLPFVLSYVVFFLAVKKLDLFEKQHAALIAVIASFFTAQFIAVNPFYQQFFVEYFGRITIGMIGILGLFILMGLAGWNISDARGGFLGLTILSIVGASFITAGGFGPSMIETGDINLSVLGPLLIDTGLIWLLVIAGVLWWTTSGEDDGDGNDGPGLGDIYNWGMGNGGD